MCNLTWCDKYFSQIPHLLQNILSCLTFEGVGSNMFMDGKNTHKLIKCDGDKLKCKSNRVPRPTLSSSRLTWCGGSITHI